MFLEQVGDADVAVEHVACVGERDLDGVVVVDRPSVVGDEERAVRRVDQEHELVGGLERPLVRDEQQDARVHELAGRHGRDAVRVDGLDDGALGTVLRVLLREPADVLDVEAPADVREDAVAHEVEAPVLAEDVEALVLDGLGEDRRHRVGAVALSRLPLLAVALPVALGPAALDLGHVVLPLRAAVSLGGLLASKQ